MKTLKRWGTGVVLLLILGLSLNIVQAGNVVLTNNTTSSSTSWFISGEPSLVMNRFDLNSRGIPLPTRLDRVGLSVITARPGNPVTVVVYQDADGGSPINATLVRSAQVEITTAGVFTYTFPEPLSITQPFVWVGFYLPVDFQFRADRSGSSQLTWWAWQPGGTFDVANLASAGVLGAADGSAPVSINMNGTARITAELIVEGSANINNAIQTALSGTFNGAGVVVSPPAGPPPIRQIVGPATDLSPMVQYDAVNACSLVLIDIQDVIVSYRSGLRAFCYPQPDYLSPPNPQGYTRRGTLYDISMYGVVNGAIALPIRVTHCIRPAANDLEVAVFGSAYGTPRQWVILPTVRFGDIICAELTHAGSVSYFVPNS
ncbi:MAG: hypothetical protein SF029_03860 [bacterium]|nr:hypothetical protein [bacterium]